MGLQIKENFNVIGTLNEFIAEKINNREEGWTRMIPLDSSSSRIHDTIEQQRGLFRTNLGNFLTNSLNEGYVFLATDPEENSSGHDYSFENPFLIHNVRRLNIRDIDMNNNGAMSVTQTEDGMLVAPTVNGSESNVRLDFVCSVIDYEDHLKGKMNINNKNTIYDRDLIVLEPFDKNVFYLKNLDKQLSNYNDEIESLQSQIEDRKSKMSNIALIRNYMKENKLDKEIKSTIKSSIILDHIAKSKNKNNLTEISEIIEINI